MYTEPRPGGKHINIPVALALWCVCLVDHTYATHKASRQLYILALTADGLLAVVPACLPASSFTPRAAGVISSASY